MSRQLLTMKISVISITNLALAAWLNLSIYADPASRLALINEWEGKAGAHLAQNAPAFLANLRGWVMFHVAQFDAVNAIEGRYMPYALDLRAPGASPEAAFVEASYTILTNIGLTNVSLLNSERARSLASIPDGSAKDNGLRVGRAAAEAIIQLRAADNPSLSVTPPTSSLPGRWRPTPPNFNQGAFAQARYLLPWTMRSTSQFRPGPPPALTSEIYTRDYNEIRQIGSLSSTNRTQAQANSAQYRETGEDFFTDIAAKRPLPFLEDIRRRALMFMAGMDAHISVFEAKYVYNFWRPITAIRAGDTDGNDATQGDPAWTPFLNTHSHPEYPSALCQWTAATFETLILLHGNDVSFTAVSNDVGRSPRPFQKLSDYIDDAITARVIGGTHFRNTCNVAVEVGQRIARHAFQNFLRPVPNLTSGVRVNPGEFQLSLNTGRVFPYLIESSSDLLQWQPWQTNTYGIVLLTDPTAAASLRFYRAVPLPPLP